MASLPRWSLPLPIAMLALGCGEPLNISPIPTADAGFDQRVAPNTEVILDGTGSGGPEGVKLVYRWRLLATPNDSAAALRASSTATPSFRTDVLGAYLVSLTVEANGRESTPDLVVVEAANTPPTIVLECGTSADCTVVHGQEAGLNGGLTRDSDGDPMSYRWTQLLDIEECPSLCPDFTPCTPTPQEVSIRGSFARNATFVAPNIKDRQLVFQFLATDGMAVSTDCLAYTVVNSLPVFTSTPSSSPASVNEGESFFLSSGTVFDPDDDPITGRWEQLTGPSIGLPGNWVEPDPVRQSINTATYTAPQVTGDTELSFAITLDDGLDTTGRAVTVTVFDVAP